MAHPIMKNIKLKLLTASIFSLTFPSIIAAEETAESLTTNIGRAVDGNFFQDNLGVFITRIVEMALIIGAIATLLYLILGAIQWITSAGDSNKVETARGHITNAIIGLAILASVWTLWILLLYFFGFNRLENFQLPAVSSGTRKDSPQTSDWWPFEDRAHWEREFRATHNGSSPTHQDFLAFKASQEYGRRCNKEFISDNEWNYYYNYGKFPDNCAQ
jgi:hypothetical protein